MPRTHDDVEIDGHTIRLTHRDKVLYPATGTTKGDVLDYYTAVAPQLLTYAGRRPVTRKRWPDGTDSKAFFEKNLPDHAPDWITTAAIEHSARTVRYPVLDSPATLAWCAQQAALELHVPQWTLEGDEPGRTRRIVIDLDPGEGVDLDTTAKVALRVRDLLADAGLTAYPVTSGSKGIHLYARLATPVSAKGATAVARQVAKTLEKQTPELVTATMTRSVRAGKVFVDWSQNSGSKTTVAPYSLRGRAEPWVSAPRAWEELGDGGLEHLHWDEVLRRLEADGDLLDGLEADAPAAQSNSGKAQPQTAQVTQLDEYRRKRDRRATPEPFDDEQAPTDERDDDSPVFVIQEHHARALHYDVRLERDGVLVSWAVPKNLPTEPRQRRLAVQTEDHPLGYGGFEGTIPRGEYGAGTVAIWDRGPYECEKWRDDEIIVWLRGERATGRYVFVRTDAEKRQWLVQRMRDQTPPDGASDDDEPAQTEADSAESESDESESDAPLPRPMIPTAGRVEKLPEAKWAFEGKWDGYRVTVASGGGSTRLSSRNGNDLAGLTDVFPGLDDALGRPAVLDGELVVLDDAGVPRFSSLARWAADSGGAPQPVELFVFDVLSLGGVDLSGEPWERRREVLDLLAKRLADVPRVHVPGVLDGPGDRALAEAEEAGWEGVVAKRRDSRYEPGHRSKAWVKQKFLTTTDAVVGGWRPGKGGRSGAVGSLLLGLPAETGLTYIGRVGTGFSDKQARALVDELEPLSRRTSPFVGEVPSDARADAVWVLPKLVVEVRHQGFTDDGLLRQASWRDVRRDKLPGDV